MEEDKVHEGLSRQRKKKKKRSLKCNEIYMLQFFVTYVMHGKRDTDIWFVFRISEFEVNFGDVICVTCILCVGLVEILNLQLRYKLR